MAKNNKVSVYISFILRHKPEEAELKMDNHGWVSVKGLIDGINAKGKHKINLEQLKEIVKNDEKGRYRFNDDYTKIKACQGHSIPWVEPEVRYMEPPEYLYHGTTTAALGKIMHSGAVLKMKRHAVHMQAEREKAWKSAVRWHMTPVVLKIDAKKMHRDGYQFGITENEVWCTEKVPTDYIVEMLYTND